MLSFCIMGYRYFDELPFSLLQGVVTFIGVLITMAVLIRKNRLARVEEDRAHLELQQGARQIVQQAIEAELASLLERFDNVKTLDERRTVIRNGYLPEREVVTAIGPVTVKVPKVRDRSGSGVKFNSDIVPPYVRKSPRVSAALPWLYLRGVSTGDMSKALSVLLGEEAKGLSPNVVSRLKDQWADEHVLWD